MAAEAGSPVEIFKTVMTKKYADFGGRARRAEYWWYILGQIIVFAILGFVSGLASGSESLGPVLLILSTVVYLAFLVPSIAVSIRRLHDIGKSGWWLLLSFIPFGGLVLLYFSVLDSTPGTNQYGPSPKYGA